MMYEGLNLKSLKEPKENIDLYRGCKLSNYEFNNLKKFLNKKNDDFPKAIVYSRTFSSFSKSKEIALKFLYDDKFFDKKKMKKVLIVLKADKYDNKYLNSFADIEKLSFFENEKEVLAFPFSCFEITEIKSYPDYEQIEFNYLSKYDAKLKKFFKNSNIKKNKQLIDSEFKKFITNSDIIKKDILIKSSVSSIISNSEKYIEKQKNIENNKENKKIQINNEYINENSLNSLSTITSKNSNVPIKHEDNNNKCKNNCFDYVCDYFKNLSNLYKGLIIAFIIVILLAIILPIALKNKNKKENAKSSNKKENLTQYTFESSQSYETFTNGKISPYIIYTKAIYDIYAYNYSISPKELNNYSSMIYTTTIAINSFCNKLILEKDENDCELSSIFNLNERKENNLRRSEENTYYLKDAILPICIVEHNDNNIIISVTCPNTLSQNLKNEIIKTFKLIKPSSINQIIYNNENKFTNLNITKRNNNIYIDIFNNECPYIDKKNFQSIDCNSTTNIIIDENKNILTTNEILSKNITQDEKNIIKENMIYGIQKIIENNSTNFNPEIYKSNLDVILPFLSFLMRKEVDVDNYNNFVHFMNSTQEQEQKTIKNNQNKEVETGLFNESEKSNILFKNIFTIPISLNLKNELGIGKSQNINSYYQYNMNRNYQIKLLSKNFNVNLDNVFKPFIFLSKSGNKLANILKKELNESLLNFKDIVYENIIQINSALTSENIDLSEIFDSILAIKQINSLPNDFIFTLENLIYSLDDLEINIPKIEHICH